MTKKIVVLGSTGSVGRQTLEVVRDFPQKFQVAGLAAGSNWSLLAEQVETFRPQAVSISDAKHAGDLVKRLRKSFSKSEMPEILTGEKGLSELAALLDAQVVVTAVTGAVGLQPTLAAIHSGKDIALANKETLVAAGKLVTAEAKNKGARIIPVDSEHSAVWQCLNGENKNDIRRIILTASGGPFRTEEIKELENVTVEMALRHPNWNMGRKITIDSATLMNKGLEVIEAKWLFDVDFDQIDVVIHPQSIIHSMIEFIDGSVLAQLGIPDMQLPIQYALSYPERWPNKLERLDFATIGQLSFERPDEKRFRCLALAYQAGRCGGTMTAVLNAANEVAVEAFLNGKTGFLDIPRVVEQVMERHKVVYKPDLETILAADRWARKTAQTLLS